MNRKEVVGRLKNLIKSVAPNSQTILYGSEARGITNRIATLTF